MNRGHQLAATVHHIFDGLQILPVSNLVHRNDLGRHGTDQHHHSLSLGTAVQNVCPDSQFILRDSLITGTNFRPFIDHTDGQSRMLCASIGKEGQESALELAAGILSMENNPRDYEEEAFARRMKKKKKARRKSRGI